MDASSVFLETAQHIAHDLVEAADWAGSPGAPDAMCNWEIVSDIDFEHPDVRVRKHAPVGPAGGADPVITTGAAGPYLYRGSAGIAFFLGALVPHLTATGHLNMAQRNMAQRVRDTALGAMRCAFHQVGTDPKAAAPGFFMGRAGVAWAADRVAEWTGEEQLRRLGEKQLDLVRPAEPAMAAFDVMSGAAGMIPAYLQLAARWQRPDLLRRAIGLGWRLIDQAHIEPDGWSWAPDGYLSSVRHLCGHSHGASGVAYGLIELYRATQIEAFRYAAEQAFRYERSVFDSEARNWPDFRYQELGAYLARRSTDDLREAIETGFIGDFQPPQMNVWCHGGPGISLSRARAVEVFGGETYRSEALHGVNVTKQAVLGAKNYSLCHGAAGNASILALASEVLGPEVRTVGDFDDMVDALARGGHSQFIEIDQDWKTGMPVDRVDPTLMIGTAGIGYFYLQRIDDTLPDVLALKAPSFSALRDRLEVPERPAAMTEWARSEASDWEEFDNAPEDDSAESPDIRHAAAYPVTAGAARARYVDRFWKQTHAVAKRLGVADAIRSVDSPASDLQESEAHRYRRQLRTWLGDAVADDAARTEKRADETSETAGENAPNQADLRDLMADASRVERHRFQLWTEIKDFTVPVVERALRTPFGDLDLEEIRLTLHPEARVVSAAYGWSAWLKHKPSDAPNLPDMEETVHLLYRTRSEIMSTRLAVFPAVIASVMADRNKGAQQERGNTVEEIGDTVLESIPPALAAQEATVRQHVAAQVHQLYKLGVIVQTNRSSKRYIPYTNPG